MSQIPLPSVSDILLRTQVLGSRATPADEKEEFSRHLAAALQDSDPPAGGANRPSTLADYRARPVPLHPQLRARLLGPFAPGDTPPAQGASQQGIDAHVQAASARYDLPPRLIQAVIRAESDFDPQAVSPAGAQGLMQLMPSTAEMLGVRDPFDVGQNIEGGARYLRQMLDRFEGSLPLALAAYNAGPGAVERCGGKVPPYPETTRYVQRVLRFAQETA